MAFLAALFLLSFLVGGSEAAWCVCNSGADETVLQAAIDFACGNGADCTSINQNGPCFEPNNRLAHCSYAVNSYFQKKNQATDACNFSGAATITPNDPSYSECLFPSLTGGASPSPTSTPMVPSVFGPTGTGGGTGGGNIPTPFLDGSNAMGRPAAVGLAIVIAIAIALALPVLALSAA